MAAVRAFMLSMLSVELLNPDWIVMSPLGPSSSMYASLVIGEKQIERKYILNNIIQKYVWHLHVWRKQKLNENLWNQLMYQYSKKY